MDVQMPVLDGVEATKRIRALPAPKNGVPIIALTASVLDSTRQACLDAGIDHFIAKPVDRQALHATLAAVLMPLDLSVRQ
jgi:two-component system sensor histidine kinase EvgS